MTPSELLIFKTAINTEIDPAVVVARQAGDVGTIATWYNGASAFIVRKKTVASDEIGPVLNYVAVSSLTVANRDRATTFLILNKASFIPTADIESYWETTFGGTLGGEGANTRAALKALWRRNATKAEKLFATGAGTSDVPGTLSFDGQVSVNDVIQAINLP